MDPPAYEAIDSSHDRKVDSWDPHAKIPTRLSLRDEVFVSRMQHVAALVAQLLPHIRARAQRGLSRTSLLILPSDRSSTKGELVGFAEDKMPIVVQLEGSYDGTQFWTQREVIDLLQEQTLVAVNDQIPRCEAAQEAKLPVRPAPEPSKYSFWGRKQSKAPEAKPAAQLARSPVTVDVEQDQFSFRAETEYGLFETSRARAVLLEVDIR